METVISCDFQRLQLTQRCVRPRFRLLALLCSPDQWLKPMGIAVRLLRVKVRVDSGSRICRPGRILRSVEGHTERQALGQLPIELFGEKDCRIIVDGFLNSDDANSGLSERGIGIVGAIASVEEKPFELAVIVRIPDQTFQPLLLDFDSLARVVLEEKGLFASVPTDVDDRRLERVDRLDKLSDSAICQITDVEPVLLSSPRDGGLNLVHLVLDVKWTHVLWTRRGGEDTNLSRGIVLGKGDLDVRLGGGGGFPRRVTGELIVKESATGPRSGSARGTLSDIVDSRLNTPSLL
jgi:hypothetical protein